MTSQDLIEFQLGFCSIIIQNLVKGIYLIVISKLYSPPLVPGIFCLFINKIYNRSMDMITNKIPDNSLYLQNHVRMTLSVDILYLQSLKMSKIYYIRLTRFSK